MSSSKRRCRRGSARAWVAFVLLTHVTGCAGAAGSRPSLAPPTRAWPDVVRLAGPPTLADCTNTTHDPSLTWVQAADGSVRPVRTLPGFWVSQKRASSGAPLPFAPPPELAAVADAARSIVAVDGEWLVAIDHGEGAGGGLYSVPAGGEGAQRLDAVLAYPVQWITKTRFGIVGVAGFCHGYACSRTMSVYRIERLNKDSPWQLYPLALVAGCPAVTVTEAGADGVLLAGGCGSLYRISAMGLTQVASWRQDLYPYEVMRSRSGSDIDAYYVSFGSVAARFQGTTAEWYVPRDCPALERGPNDVCQCASNASSPSN